ncbi:hypothetical protein LWI28_002753 [Acer negundo]|uniref:JmjC domain-containing protein n=1 Tax=Acer negundo TaxID=4023 RepID=A0AAD5P0W8_ACENE|nr:hypothetical protein LWI28_002753 [Acer negundo]
MDHLSTPILDDESPRLLQAISEHGGYAYVGMVAQASAGDIRAAEAACEMAWEQLHSGPWHSVLPVWRDAYSMACIHVAKYHYRNGELGEALRVLDMGVIMGGSLLRKDLDSAIETVSAKAREAQNGGSGEVKRLVSQEFDKAEALRVLPVRSLSCKLVVKRSALSLEGFLCDFMLSGSPVIITDCMGHWPARTRWNDIDYLKKVAGDRTVPVEFKCFAGGEKLFMPRMEARAYHIFPITELRKDICTPDYCFAGGGELRSLNAWFGPARTVTPLHHDPHHNILAQVVGKKYIRLYPASLSEELHPYTETMLCNSSQVDLDHIDETKFPNVPDLDFLDCILDEGEMLYIPPKWWHYVRSLSISFSVSFWWSNSGSSTES